MHRRLQGIGIFAQRCFRRAGLLLQTTAVEQLQILGRRRRGLRHRNGSLSRSGFGLLRRFRRRELIALLGRAIAQTFKGNREILGHASSAFGQRQPAKIRIDAQYLPHQLKLLTSLVGMGIMFQRGGQRVFRQNVIAKLKRR